MRRAGASNSNSATAARSFSRCREKKGGAGTKGQRSKSIRLCCTRLLHCCIAALLPEEWITDRLLSQPCTVHPHLGVASGAG